MMLSADFVVLASVSYVGLLFLLAWGSDHWSRQGRGGFLRSPLVYTLSISVYCTSWTFYGAVGTAARNGLEFMAIYMGPTLVFVGWWFLLRRLLRIGHAQRITSIADFLSSRYGKSSRIAVLVTVIAMVTITPYIALQLKAITASLQVITQQTAGPSRLSALDDGTLALIVAAGMAVFTILFGTRNVDAREQHPGVVAAIAFEAVIKLLALVAVGLWVLTGLSDGPSDIFARASAAGYEVHEASPFGSRWVTVLFLSAAAVICLPRQFQITVVENSREDHLRTAAWAFPLYMLIISLFTLPIAYQGLATLPAGANPDMFVLTLPLAAGQDGLALLAFIGGFSSATSMIIVASIALSIMVSNHIVLPLALRLTDGLSEAGTRGFAGLLLMSRRVSIALILFSGFLYFWLTGESGALATIGLISFAGVVQFLPALLAALYWRRATMAGALSGMAAGFALWAWTLFLPSFAASHPRIRAWITEGPGGLSLLRPEALFGMEGVDPLVHAIFWSLLVNAGLLVLISLITRQSATEQNQADAFADCFTAPALPPGTGAVRARVTAEDLFFLAERVLGWHRAQAMFSEAGIARAGSRAGEAVPPAFVARLEREMAGLIGAASAHILLSKIVEGDGLSLEEAMQIAGETLQVISHSNELERKSDELRLTARKLQEANAKLHALHRQKDDFLSQVSHEVRTPMTSIRSISEILMQEAALPDHQRARFVELIHQESLRLTRLLDEILDLSALEHGERDWINRPIDGRAALSRACDVCEALARPRKIAIRRPPPGPPVRVMGDPDRLAQVFINIIANAISHNRAADPEVLITTALETGGWQVDICDNGAGIAPEFRDAIFEKFLRLTADPGSAGGSLPGLGLGLSISSTILQKLGGEIALVDGPLPGACFRITLPLAQAEEDPAPQPEGLSAAAS